MEMRHMEETFSAFTTNFKCFTIGNFELGGGGRGGDTAAQALQTALVFYLLQKEMAKWQKHTDSTQCGIAEEDQQNTKD